MRFNWRTVKLQEIVLFKTGKLDSNAAEVQGLYPFFTCSPITLAINNYAFDTEAVLLAGNNANGVFAIKYYNGKFNAYQRTYVITPIDESVVSVKWLYFRIKHVTAELQQMSVGTATKFLTKKILDAYEVQLPPIEEQEKQAKILWDLQNKLDLNSKTNQTLEEMAEAIFKSWFVDFNPVKAKMNGEQPEDMDAATASLFPEKLDSETGIPVGWSQGVIADIAKLNAKSWTKKNHPEQVHYVDLANTKNGVIETVTTYDFNEAPSRARRILNSGDTIVGTVRPGNRSFSFIGDTEQPLTGSTGFAVLSPKEEFWMSFVYLATTNDDTIDEYARLADGGAYPAIKPIVVADTSCVIPTKEIAQKFWQFTGVMLKKAHQNRLENEELAKLRDTLLPKLLLGELSSAPMVEEG